MNSVARLGSADLSLCNHPTHIVHCRSIHTNFLDIASTRDSTAAPDDHASRVAVRCTKTPHLDSTLIVTNPAIG